jgi:hypothetical protein
MDYVLRSTVNNPLRRLCFGTFSVDAFLVPQAPQALKGKGAGRGNVVLPPGAKPAYDVQYIGEPHGSPK